MLPPRLARRMLLPQRLLRCCCSFRLPVILQIAPRVNRAQGHGHGAAQGRRAGVVSEGTANEEPEGGGAACRVGVRHSGVPVQLPQVHHRGSAAPSRRTSPRFCPSNLCGVLCCAVLCCARPLLRSHPWTWPVSSCTSRNSGTNAPYRHMGDAPHPSDAGRGDRIYKPRHTITMDADVRLCNGRPKPTSALRLGWPGGRETEYEESLAVFWAGRGG